MSSSATSWRKPAPSKSAAPCPSSALTLSLMKPTAYLVNTSRGPVVDHEALAEALRNKVLAGAGIDVYDKEPPADWAPS